MLSKQNNNQINLHILILAFLPMQVANWPHPRCDVCLEDDDCVFATVVYPIMSSFTGWLTETGFDLALFSSVSSENLCIFSLHSAIHI